MGSRGAFVNTDFGDFRFKSNGQTFQMLGWVGDVKVIQRANGLAVKAPEFSHTPGRIYAIVQNNKLKHLATYDENHNLIRCVDFAHPHNNLIPHVHFDYNHNKIKEVGKINEKELEIVRQLEKKGISSIWK